MSNDKIKSDAAEVLPPSIKPHSKRQFKSAVIGRILEIKCVSLLTTFVSPNSFLPREGEAADDAEEDAPDLAEECYQNPPVIEEDDDVQEEEQIKGFVSRLFLMAPQLPSIGSTLHGNAQNNDQRALSPKGIKAFFVDKMTTSMKQSIADYEKRLDYAEDLVQTGKVKVEHSPSEQVPFSLQVR
jgi:hypothetical protein